MQQFNQLITGLCALTGISVSDQLTAGDAICVEGVKFALAINAQSDPDALLLYADFGSLDFEKKAMLYPLLLKENVMLMGSRNSTFGVSQRSGSVVLIECFSLTATTPDVLLARMRLLAHKANYFNKHHRGGYQAANRSSAIQSAMHRSFFYAQSTS